MKKIYYEKVGRRYKPVAEYNTDFMDSFHKGTHLVHSYPSGISRRFNIEPAFAPMIAAGIYAEDAITKAIAEASSLRPCQTPITETQQKAWKKFSKEMGEEMSTLQGLSVRDCAEAGVRAMQDEVEKTMKHPAVQAAYEEFMLVYKLCHEGSVR
jgi:hypothetical protein